ncbi:hypothetical protein [Paracoccus sp. KR1-242]|uniref:hypothetical protein n=1 Tax=Paracoccus sp. KR1-242 TaxID=3410028 RepID=UPI003C07578C
MNAPAPTLTWQQCHAAGMTAPEAAAAMGMSEFTAYRWARKNGVRWTNRKRGSSREHMVAISRSKARLQGIRRAAERRNKIPINGWTWAQLFEAGFTGPEAARVRGMTKESAYAWADRRGLEWPQHHTDPRRNPAAGLSPEERAFYDRLTGYNWTSEERLRILGREDLIKGRMLGDPIQHVARMMAEDAARASARLKASAAR